MKKILLICNSDGALAIFRGPLIRALVSAGHEVVTVSPRSHYFNALEQMGARPIELEFSRHSTSVFRNFGLLRDLVRTIRYERPDIVHSFTHKAAIYGSFAARLAAVKKIVATITGLGTLFIRSDIRSYLLRCALILQYKLLLPGHTKVLFQNPDDKHVLETLRAIDPRQSILTNGSGIDLEETTLPDDDAVVNAKKTLAAEIGTNIDGRIVVLFPARGVPEKGLREFYDAAHELNTRFPQRYVFCHMGLIDADASGAFGADEVSVFAQEHGVHYLGFKPNPLDYTIAADIVALPSYREGVPRSLIEALALGKCIVATDVPGCRETVVDNWNGFLCRVRSSASLADAFAKVDLDFLAVTGPRSRQLCEDKFDVRKLNALTFNAYGLPSPNPEASYFRSETHGI